MHHVISDKYSVSQIARKSQQEDNGEAICAWYNTDSGKKKQNLKTKTTEIHTDAVLNVKKFQPM